LICFTELVIAKNRITVTVLLFFLIGGVIALFSMPRAKDPNFTIHTGVVTTLFPGATPERVESLITVPLERKLRQIDAIDHFESISKNGMSLLYITIKDEYSDIEPIWSEVRKNIGDVMLPPEASRARLNESYNEVFGTLITLVGEGLSFSELEDIANEVKQELLRIHDVGNIEILGIQKEHIYIEFSNAKLAELGLSPKALAHIISQRNSITPGGSIEIGSQQLVLEPSGNIKSVEELGKTIVPLPKRDQVLYLEDIVTIKKGYSDPKDPIIRYNNESALLLAVSVSKHGNIVTMGNAVKQKMSELVLKYPIGVEFAFAFDESNLVDEITSDFGWSLIESIIIIMLVMLFTLGWKMGLIVTSLIPSAILASLFIMWQFDIGLNQVSLAAMIISLGLLVDNAIVISEAIAVKIEEGMPSLKAAILSVKELRFSLLTSSLTTSAAFLPIYLADSPASQYTSALFEVVSITLLCSWLFAMTIVPMLIVTFLKRGEHFNGINNGFVCYFFKDILIASLKNRRLALVAIASITLLSIIVATFIPKSFFPPSQQPTMVLDITLPKNATLEATEQQVNELELLFERMKSEDKIIDYTSFIGKGAPRYWINNTPIQQANNRAEILINIQDIRQFEALKQQISLFAFTRFDDMRLSVTKLDNGPPVKKPVQIRVSGRDDHAINSAVNALKVALHDNHMVEHIEDDWGLWSQKLVVNINPSLAYHAGVSYQNIANSLQIALDGHAVTQFRTHFKSIPIVLRSNQSVEKSIEALKSTLVFVPKSGKSVPLSQVAEIEVVWKAPKIIRYNLKHTVTVEADVLPGNTAFDVKESLKHTLKTHPAFSQVSVEFGGDVESSNQAQGAIAKKLPIAIMIILVILMVQFNSIRRVGLILISIPLGVIGVIIGLVVTQSYFGFMSYLGVISLMGIVINNAIILIERIEYEIDVMKQTRQNAIIEAAQRRFRPIMLTTLTTIGGLVPLWIGGGTLWAPMAIALIFGLAFSTLLTLGVVPIFYSLLFNVRYTKKFKYINDNACLIDTSK